MVIIYIHNIEYQHYEYCFCITGPDKVRYDQPELPGRDQRPRVRVRLRTDELARRTADLEPFPVWPDHRSGHERVQGVVAPDLSIHPDSREVVLAWICVQGIRATRRYRHLGGS